jgi:hypothetical protein
MDQNKKISLLVVAIIVIAALGYWGFKQGWFLKKSPNSSTTPVGSNSIQQVPGGKLAANMPTDIILPKDAKITSSYTGITPDGKNQSTVIFSTLENPATVIQDYRKYFGKNSWAVEPPLSPIKLNGKNINGQELDINTFQAKGLTIVSITLLSSNAK